MCKGLLANFLLSPLEVIFLLVKDGELPFLVEEAGVTVLVGVFDAGFELFGVEIGDALEVGSIDFFLVLAEHERWFLSPEHETIAAANWHQT